MLLIPIHQKLDWSRPPWATAILILANLLIFLFFQADDEEHLADAVQIYEEAELLELERPVYQRYLTDRQADGAEPSDWEDGWEIAFDRNFDRYLRTYWDSHDPQEELQLTLWRKSRLEFEAERDQVSGFRAGLVPAENRWWTYLTSTFLHGGGDHLIGNMVFLFLFGFTLEAALGPALYLTLYIICGIAAGGIHVLLHLGSPVPLIGASGAISGLMGMYVSLYKLQKIRFFYTVFFYFGELRAPAIMILPLWLCKEIYDYFFTESDVAYMAHVGGLLAGAALMLVLRPYLLGFQKEEESKASDDKASAGLARIQSAITALDFDRARAMVNQLCEQHPQDVRVWRKRFYLAKLSPQNSLVDETMAKFARQFAESQGGFDLWREEFESMLKEYSARSPSTPGLSSGCLLELAEKYWQKGWRERAEELVKSAISKEGATDEVKKILELWGREYRQIGRLDRAKYIETFIVPSTQRERPIR